VKRSDGDGVHLHALVYAHRRVPASRDWSAARPTTVTVRAVDDCVSHNAEAPPPLYSSSPDGKTDTAVRTYFISRSRREKVENERREEMKSTITIHQYIM